MLRFVAVPNTAADARAFWYSVASVHVTWCIWLAGDGLVAGRLGNCSQPGDILVLRPGQACQESYSMQVSINRRGLRFFAVVFFGFTAISSQFA
jgi:hypothetical protein